MNLNFPPKVRQGLYIATIVLSPVVLYLRATNVIGDAEMSLWGAEVMAVSGLAAINVPKQDQ